jgi:glycerate-2-kinase
VLSSITLNYIKRLDKSLNVLYNNSMSYLPEKKRNLTEKQEAFLNHLVETGGDFKKSAELAGYSGNHYQILKSLKNEVVDLASDVLAREAPTAAFKLIEVMKSDKPVPQANNKLQAAQTILDRAGVVKTDKLDVNHNVSGGIFILPEKHTIDIEAEDVSYE